MTWYEPVVVCGFVETRSHVPRYPCLHAHSHLHSCHAPLVVSLAQVGNNTPVFFIRYAENARRVVVAVRALRRCGLFCFGVHLLPCIILCACVCVCVHVRLCARVGAHVLPKCRDPSQFPDFIHT
jgi:hypothetical protein